MNIGKLTKMLAQGARGEFDKDMALEFLSSIGIEAEGGEPVPDAQVVPVLQQIVQPGRTFLSARLKFKSGASADLFVALDKGQQPAQLASGEGQR